VAGVADGTACVAGTGGVLLAGGAALVTEVGGAWVGGVGFGIGLTGCAVCSPAVSPGRTERRDEFRDRTCWANSAPVEGRGV
jgi:hypothetical protein